MLAENNLAGSAVEATFSAVQTVNNLWWQEKLDCPERSAVPSSSELGTDFGC